MKPNSLFEIKNLKVYLSEEAKAMPLDALFTKAQEVKLEVSRATLSRAKKFGYFAFKYHRPGFFQRRPNIGFVRLSDAEQKKTPTEVAHLFGINWTTAKRAIERGWFEVASTNVDTISDLARGRMVATLDGGR